MYSVYQALLSLPLKGLGDEASTGLALLGEISLVSYNVMCS